MKKSERHTKQYNSTLLGAGSTVAAASCGDEKFDGAPRQQVGERSVSQHQPRAEDRAEPGWLGGRPTGRRSGATSRCPTSVRQ